MGIWASAGMPGRNSLSGLCKVNLDAEHQLDPLLKGLDGFGRELRFTADKGEDTLVRVCPERYR